MGIAIVHHQANLLHVGRMLINKFLDKVRPINFCPLICYCYCPSTGSRFKSHENICRAISFIFRVILERVPRLY
jgi:hypothetical protein